MPKTFAELAALPAPEPDDVLRYGDLPQQFIELWRPVQIPRGLLVVIHGGCWQNAYGVDHIRPMADVLRAQGYLVWAPEYRRIGDAGGGWTGTFNDIAVVADAAGSAGGRDGSVLPVLLAGHSAGGHLALWAACRPQFAEPSPFYTQRPMRPRGVLGLAAITDLRSYALGESSCERSTVELLGGLPEQQPARYAATSPIEQVPVGTPVALVQGMADEIVPAHQAERFLEAALAAGDSANLRYVPGAGHFDLIYPGTMAFATGLASLRELL